MLVGKVFRVQSQLMIKRRPTAFSLRGFISLTPFFCIIFIVNNLYSTHNHTVYAKTSNLRASSTLGVPNNTINAATTSIAELLHEREGKVFITVQSLANVLGRSLHLLHGWLAITGQCPIR